MTAMITIIISGNNNLYTNYTVPIMSANNNNCNNNNYNY